MNLRPVETQHLDEKLFNEAVAAQDVQCEGAPLRGELHADTGGITCQARLREGLHHGGGGSGDDPQRLSDATHRGFPALGSFRERVDVFDVVLDRRTGHNNNIHPSRRRAKFNF